MNPMKPIAAKTFFSLPTNFTYSYPLHPVGPEFFNLCGGAKAMDASFMVNSIRGCKSI
jgi:hypothetical protein